MPGIDAFTKLMLHGEALIDDSQYQHSPVLAFGDAHSSAVDSKFGGRSLLFDGTGDYLTVPDSTDWNLGSGDFTIDFWANFSSSGISHGLFGRSSGSGYYYLALEGTSKLRLRDYQDGGTLDMQRSWVPNLGQWYHIAVVRNVNEIRMYIDGTQLGVTYSFSGTLIDRTADLLVGSTFTSAYHSDAYMDEIRISKGIARWTTDFTPETSAYISNSPLVDINTDIRVNENLIPTDWLFGWGNRKRISIDHTKIDGVLTDFPVLVKLDNTNFDFAKADSTGFDIRFTSDDEATLIKFERILHDDVGEEAIYWVKIPSISNTATTHFYMYYNNTGQPDDSDMNNTWNSDYTAVWHLEELSTNSVDEFLDSTSNNHHGEGVGSLAQVAAIVGQGQQGANGKLIEIPHSTDWDLGAGDFTIEFKTHWVGSVTSGSIMGHDNGGGAQPKWMLLYTGTFVEFATAGNSIQFVWSPLPNTDYHCTLVRSGNDWKFYVNGSQTGTTVTNSVTVDNSTNFLALLSEGEGWQYHQGILDEVRFLKGIAKSEEYISAVYESDIDNLTTFGFEQVGEVEDIIDVDTDIRARYGLGLIDVDTDIRAVNINIEDISTDIRASFTNVLEDINTDIRSVAESFKDINSDIRTQLESQFIDIDVDVRVNKLEVKDIDTDIRVSFSKVTEDINTDIRVAIDDVTEDINTDIRVKPGVLFKDIDTDIRIVGKGLEDVSCDIRATYFVNSTNVDFVSMYFQDGDFTNNLDVTIILDVNDAINMQFKNAEDSVFSAWEPYSEFKEYTLSPGNGLKTVDVRFQDAGGLITESYKVFITFNDDIPLAVIIEAYNDETLITQINDSVYQNDNSPFFRWRVPTDVIPYYGFSYALDAEPSDYINVQITEVIRDGLEITKAAPLPEMTLDVASGNFYSDGSLGNLDTTTITLENGGTQDRIDVVYIDSTSTVVVEKGEEAVIPIAPIIGGIPLAQILIPAGETLIANTILTDIREMYINLDAYILSNLEYGEHQLRVKAFNSCDKISNESVFNLYIANMSPEMGQLAGYTDGTKLFQVFSSIYQAVSDSVYLEWTAAPNQPGPIYYYYTTDGSEPDIGDSYVSVTNVSLGAFSEGYTTIKVKPYDTVSGNYGTTREFIFLYGQAVPIGETVVVGNNGITLKQSLKQVQVRSVSFNFDSARLCNIFHPVAFDADLPYNLNDIVTVVYGGETVFSGYIKRIDREINMDGEGVVYACVGARGELTEVYAVRKTGTIDTASIDFEDVPLQTALNEVIAMSPSIIKAVESLPIGSNVFEIYKGQTIEQIISSLYRSINYGWYMKPDGTLVTVDLSSINSGQAKFGVYGTTVNSMNPQYNVISSDLQFDGSKRYNKVIIEGAIKQVRRNKLNCRSFDGVKTDYALDRNKGFKKYEIITNQKVTKVIKTYVCYKRMISSDFNWSPDGGQTTITAYERCIDNNRTYIKKKTASWLYEPPVPYIFLFNADPNARSVFPQGSLGSDNIISFQYPAYNGWFENFAGNFTNTPGTRFVRTAATVLADCLVETIPLRVEISVLGTADSLGSKVLRIINTNYKYIEDPDNPIDNTAEMIDFANERLAKLKDIKINGAIVLDTIDTSWTLEKTVNLINTEQGSWSTLNAKIVGISYNFDSNTTTLELTSEYLK